MSEFIAHPDVCVVYLLRSADSDGFGGSDAREVLLGVKKTGLGEGNLIAPGGKLQPGESAMDAAVREVLEETGLTIEAAALQPRGRIDYRFPSKPSWSQVSWVFVCESWTGEPAESDELAPAWVRVGEIPFERMWDDARRWLPGVLNGGSIQAQYVFGDDLKTVVA